MAKDARALMAATADVAGEKVAEARERLAAYEEQEILEKADVEKQEIVGIFQQYGVTAEECARRFSRASGCPHSGVKL